MPKISDKNIEFSQGKLCALAAPELVAVADEVVDYRISASFLE